MSMYMPLIAKMVENIPSFMVDRVNFELFCDMNLFISLSYLIPSLETIHVSIKFKQKWDVFVCDYVVVLKICKGW
jgi:hypothetical protein